MFQVSYHAAGCLPDSEAYPVLFHTVREAWQFVEDELEADFNDETYLPAHTALHLTNRDEIGSLPHVGTYAWHVERADIECECAYVPGDSGHEFHCPIRNLEV